MIIRKRNLKKKTENSVRAVSDAKVEAVVRLLNKRAISLIIGKIRTISEIKTFNHFRKEPRCKNDERRRIRQSNRGDDNVSVDIRDEGGG